MFSTGSYTNANGNQIDLKNGYLTHIENTFYERSTHNVNNTSSYQCWDIPEIRVGLFPILHHLPTGGKIKFEHKRVQYTLQQINDAHNGLIPTDFLRSYYSPEEFQPLVRFLHITKGVTIFKELPNCERLTEVKNLSMMLQASSTHKIRVYQNIRQHELLIVTSEYSWELLRKVIALIPLVFPQLNLPNDIIPILSAFGASNFERWYLALTKWLYQHDFMTEKIRKAVAEIVNQQRNSQITSYRDMQATLERQINEALESLGIKYSSLENAIQQLNSLLMSPEQSSDELYQYLKNHQSIKSIDASGSYMYLNIVTPLRYYDLDALKIYYKSSRSTLTSKPKLARLFDEIFFKNKYTLYTETACYIDFSRNIAQTDQDATHLQNQLVKQPHIMSYRCWGNNGREITKLLGKGDYIMAIEQIVAATQNINFVDSTVFEYFIDYMLKDGHRKLSIKDTEGNMLSAYDIFKKYEQEEKNETDQSIARAEAVTA